MTNLCESVCSTRIANQLGSDSWVKELVIKFVWVQMTNFRGTFLSTHTLSLWNSDLWVILLDLQPRWLRNRHITSNRRRFDIDITSMHRKKNIDKFPPHFDVLSRCNFNGRKIDVVSPYFLRCNERKIDFISTYFLWCKFDKWKIDVFLTYFLRRNFDERNIEVVSMCLFGPDFD